MPKVLAFTESSHKLVAPTIAGGLPEGLVLQLWVRRTGAGTRLQIVELAAGADKIVLGSGERPDVLSFAVTQNGKTQELAAWGGLPEDRWVLVCAKLHTNGWATLAVNGVTAAQSNIGGPGQAARTVTIGGGFVGELAELQIWRHPDPGGLSSGPPPLDHTRLYGYWPLSEATLDPASKKFVSADAAVNKRHALAATAVPSVVHDEALADPDAAFVQFKSPAAVILSPVPSSTGVVALEAWVRIDSDEALPSAVIQVGTDNQRLVLAAGGKDGEVALVLIEGDKATTVCRATGLVKKGEWSHVAATVGTHDKSRQMALAVYHQGHPRKWEGLLASDKASKFGALAELMRQPFYTGCRLGGGGPSLALFVGGMAEARIWRSAAAERVGAMWLARARGDEDHLVACYRLDAGTSELVDLSPRRGLGAGWGELAVVKQGGPPLASTTSATRAFQVAARGKLVREPLPAIQTQKVKPKNDKTKILLDVRPIHSPGANGQSSLFDATIEVSARDAQALTGRSLEVRVDRPLTAVLAQAEVVTYAQWKPGEVHVVALPGSGRVRLRFVADAMTCPTIRVRVRGAAGGVWTPVRPDEPAQTRLRGVSGASLKSPGEGRKSPLPAGASDDDAKALAAALQQLASQFAPPAVEMKPQAKGLLGDAWDYVQQGTGAALDYGEDLVQGGQDLGSALVSAGGSVIAGVTRTAKSAGSLLKRTTADIQALAAKASKTTTRYGQQAISSLIDSADQVAIVAAEAGRWVEVVGTIILDGVEQGWRAVVSGVEDAFAAVAALLRRIGAEIVAFIQFLAYLFAWGDFLDASDEALAVFEKGLNKLPGAIAGLDPYKAKLTEMLQSTVEQAIGKKSLADMFGIDVDAAAPVMEPLEYFMEQVQRAFDSSSLALEGLGADEALKSLDAGLSQQAGQLERLTPAITDVRGYLATPLSQVLANNGPLADGSPSLIDGVFDALIGGAQATAKQISKQLQARISVPWLTDMIETTILGGRKLTMARVVALMAAIMGVLTEKTSGKGKSAKVATKSGIAATSKSGKTVDEDTRWVVWVCTALGFANSVLLIAKTAQEFGKDPTDTKKNGPKLMICLSGGLIALRGFMTTLRLTAYPAKTQTFAAVNSALELASGSWIVCALINEVDATTDLAVTSLLGVAMTTTSVVALSVGQLKTDYEKASFSLRCASWITNALARISDKGDDKDKSGNVKLVTGGLALAAIVTDITEAIYVNVNEAQTS